MSHLSNSLSLYSQVMDLEVLTYFQMLTYFLFQLVVDWLERNAEEELAAYQERVEFFTDQTAAW